MSSPLLSAGSANLPSERNAITLRDFESIAEVELVISAELARRSMSISDVLGLEVDDLLILPRSTGENVDVFAGDVLVGSAEILASEDNFAIRVADLLGRPAALSVAEQQGKPLAANDRPKGYLKGE